VSDPQSAGRIDSDNASGERPTGPGSLYASVIQVSLWMLLRGFGAMPGLRGARVYVTGSGVAVAPWNAGNVGRSGSAIGSAEAAGARAGTNAIATAHIRRMGIAGP
jgi:hypothetical protein